MCFNKRKYQRPRRRGRGFTLIEVMISVLVLSIALGASVSVLGQYADGQGHLERRYIAHLIAWNELIRSFSYGEMELNKKKSSNVLSKMIEFADARWRVNVDSQRLGKTSMRLYEVRVHTLSGDKESAILKAYLRQ